MAKPGTILCLYEESLSSALLLTIAPHLFGATGYLQRNLISDVAGAADLTDPNLVNAWGIAITAASPFWVCDAGTAMSTVYTASASTFAISATKASCPRLTRTGLYQVNVMDDAVIVQIRGFGSPKSVTR